MGGTGGTGGANNRQLTANWIASRPGEFGLEQAWAGQSPEQRLQSASYILDHPGEFEMQGQSIVPTSYPGEGRPLGSFFQWLNPEHRFTFGSTQGGGAAPSSTQTQSQSPPSQDQPASTQTGSSTPSLRPGESTQTQNLANYIYNNYAGALGLGEAWGQMSPMERWQSASYIAEHPNEFELHDGRLAPESYEGVGQPISQIPASGMGPGGQEPPAGPPWGNANPNQRWDPWWEMPSQPAIGHVQGFVQSPWGTPYGEGLGKVPPHVQAQLDAAAVAGSAGPTTSTSTTSVDGGGAGNAVLGALAGPLGLLALQQMMNPNSVSSQAVGSLWNWVKGQLSPTTPGSGGVDTAPGSGDFGTGGNWGGDGSETGTIPPEVMEAWQTIFGDGEQPGIGLDPDWLAIANDLGPQDIDMISDWVGEYWG